MAWRYITRRNTMPITGFTRRFQFANIRSATANGGASRRVADVKPDADQRVFFLACLLEMSLLGVAGIYSGLADQPLLGSIKWRAADSFVSVVAAVPLLVLFRAALGSGWKPMVEVRQFLEETGRPIFARWSVVQLAVISTLAGLSEEIFFRGALQGGLTKPFGTAFAIAVASAVFGLCHWVNRAYGVLAACIGIYFSALWLLTDNLLTPIVAHALYDFIALLYFLRMHRPNRNG